MSKVLIDEQHLSDIADAIREKLDVENTYKPSQMASAIMRITNDHTEDATLSSGSQLRYGITAYAKGVKYTGEMEDYNGSIDGGQGSIPSYDYYTGSYIITPSTVSQAYPTASKIMTQDLQVEAYSEAVLSDITIVSNGTYSASSGVDGYSTVVVSVPEATMQMMEISVDGEGVLRTSQMLSIERSDVNLVWFSAFKNCKSLYTVSLPNCEYVYNGAFAGCIDLSAVNLDSCQSIGNSVFEDCVGLRSISLPSCVQIGIGAFAGCTALSAVDLPVLPAIPSAAFEYCSSLNFISIPSCTSIGAGAFKGCTSLAAFSAPDCQYVGVSAFAGCSTLTAVNLESCTSIDARAFQGLPLVSISIPECVTIGESAFANCEELYQLSLPKCEVISSYAFSGCTGLYINEFPEVRTIGKSAFASSPYMTQITLPKCSYIADRAFYACKSIYDLYLMGSSICRLESSTAFWLTAIQSIYLPLSLQNQYTADSVWSKIFQVHSSKVVWQ